MNGESANGESANGELANDELANDESEKGEAATDFIRHSSFAIRLQLRQLGLDIGFVDGAGKNFVDIALAIYKNGCR